MDDNTGLVDIIEPATPPVSEWGLTVALVIALMVILALTVSRLRSRRWQAHVRLRRLRRRLRKQQVEPRAALFEVVSQLRTGLNRSRLEPATAVADSTPQQRRWAEFVQRLTSLRYGAAPPSESQALAAIAEARRWLRPWT